MKKLNSYIFICLLSIINVLSAATKNEHDFIDVQDGFVSICGGDDVNKIFTGSDSTANSTANEENYGIKIEKTKLHEEIDSLVAQSKKDDKGGHEEIQVTLDNAPQLCCLIKSAMEAAKLSMPDKIILVDGTCAQGFSYKKINECNTLSFPSYISQILTENEIRAIVLATVNTTGLSSQNCAFNLKIGITKAAMALMLVALAPIVMCVGISLFVPRIIDGGHCIPSILGKLIYHLMRIPFYASMIVGAPFLGILMILIGVEDVLLKNNVLGNKSLISDLYALKSAIKKIHNFNQSVLPFGYHVTWDERLAQLYKMAK